MDNHYHIVIETIEGNLSQGMRQLNGVYTQTSNRRHHRVGHVFQGRYKAILIEKESYLLELCRYVVLNPIRANMINDVADWPWSSYAAMLGKIPKGTQIFEGAAAPQPTGVGQILGGGNQVYIPRVNPKWIQ